MKVSWQRVALVVGIAAINILLDQWTKGLAVTHLQGQPDRLVLGEFFRLTYAENTGAFLSLGSQLSEQIRYWVLHIFPVVLIVALFIYTLRSRDLHLWQIVALSFILGGGLSNVYDRLLYGGVVDFMHMRVLGVQTGIFNVADVSIMAGLFMMLPFAFRKTDEEERKIEHPVQSGPSIPATPPEQEDDPRA